MYHKEKDLFYSNHEIGTVADSGVQAAKLDRACTNELESCADVPSNAGSSFHSRSTGFPDAPDMSG